LDRGVFIVGVSARPADEGKGKNNLGLGPGSAEMGRGGYWCREVEDAPAAGRALTLEHLGRQPPDRGLGFLSPKP
jgi:hypothetical protein